MQIDFGGAGFQAGIERGIPGPHNFPVVGALVECVQIESRIAWRVGERGDDGIEIGLAGLAAHG